MRRDQLEHVIRAACDILGDDEVVVIGSQAILASYPDADLPPVTTMSMEVDVVPLDDPDEEKIDLVDGAMGEGSSFDETHGYYGHGVGQRTALLPAGWRSRLVPVRVLAVDGRTVVGHCLEAHDLCAAKLAAGRDKDVEFVSGLVRAGLVDHATLLDRLAATDMPPDRRDLAVGLLDRPARRFGACERDH